ncbi:hypothetical protein [Kitasatospora camelliae]|uniref:Uncharacterized protein n=1 Tax=Kitasatospora camelliae TaxID=3156397 RepID=A0AAU8K7V9_9ACTN
MLDHIPPPSVHASPVRVTSRVALSLLSLAAGVAGTLWLQELAEPTEGLAGLRRALRPEGYAILAFQLVAVVTGTAVHGLAHLPRPRRIGAAWGAAGVVLGHALLVAVLTWPLAGVAPELSHGSSRYDSGALDPAWLACVLLPAAVAACVGGFFPRPAPDREPTVRAALRPAVFATATGWVIGGVLLLLLLVMALLRGLL